MTVEAAMTVEENLSAIRSELPEGVRLCAVSKFHGKDKIMSAYHAGQRLFGENRVQELVAKARELPADIEWHLIGHLQTNKVRQVVPVAAMIESVDSPRLLAEINRCAAKVGKIMPVLLEIHVAIESTKSGFAIAECREFMAGGAWRDMANVRICGLMAMASNTDDAATVERDFQRADDFFAELKAEYFTTDASFCLRSWGMSGDYRIALRHSANIVRIGTAIFGPREY